MCDFHQDPPQLPGPLLRDRSRPEGVGRLVDGRNDPAPGCEFFCRGKVTIVPDLGENGDGRGDPDPGDRGKDCEIVAPIDKTGDYFGVDLHYLCIDHLNDLQMLLEQNSVDRAEVGVQRIEENFFLLLDPGNRDAFHNLLDRNSIKEAAQDKLSCFSENVGNHRCPVDPHGFEDLVNAVDMIGSLLNEFVPCPGEFAQLAVVSPEDPGRFDLPPPAVIRAATRNFLWTSMPQTTLSFDFIVRPPEGRNCQPRRHFPIRVRGRTYASGERWTMFTTRDRSPRKLPAFPPPGWQWVPALVTLVCLCRSAGTSPFV